MKKTLIISFIGIIIATNLTPTLVQASFHDVNSSNPYHEAVQYLEEKDVIQSTEKTNFYPNKKIVFVDLLKMSLKMNQVPVTEGETETPFTDVKKTDWFAPYVKKALDLRVIQLNTLNPTIQPHKKVSRGEAVRIMLEMKGIGIPKTVKKDAKMGYKDVKKTSSFAPIAQKAWELGIVDGDTFKASQKITRGEAAELLYRIDTLEHDSFTEQSTTPTVQIIPDSATYSPIEQQLINSQKFQILLDVWNNIKEQYVDKNKIKNEELIYGAIAGMVEKLKDPYSNFQEPQKAEDLKNALKGNFSGVGIVIESIENKVTVISALTGTPAQKAGIKAYDIITKVDGKTAEGLTIEQVSNMIQGPTGTQVILTIQRETKMLTFTLTREIIKLTTVNGKIMQDTNIEYIEIINFGENTANEFAKTIKDLNTKNPKGLIIDLRNNPGGYLDISTEILNHFITKGNVSTRIEFANGNKINYVSEGPAELQKYPMAILVNESTASAAEIMAAAIQESKIGKIIGAKTFGKGVVQEITSYLDGSLLKLTVAKWFTPSGKNITGQSIIPDTIVNMNSQDTVAGKDPQMEAAIQYIQSK